MAGELFAECDAGLMGTAHLISVTTTGSAGSATGSAESPVTLTGLLQAIYINFTSVPGTTHVLITVPEFGNFTLLDYTGNTDTMFLVRFATCDNTGAADDGTTAFHIPNLKVKVTVDSSNAATDGVKVILGLI